VASKKRRSGRPKAPRQGISGNPQRRAEQLAQRRLAEQDLSPLRELAYALAGGADPSPWWAGSHQRILAAARALTWPSRLVDLETQACRVVGDEFYDRFTSEQGGLHASQWLRTLAEEIGAALRASVDDGTGDWPQLWALLRGLVLTVPPGEPDSKTAQLARESFPDIKDPYETVLAEAARAVKLLADRGLAADPRLPAGGARPVGDPLVACDTYGSRFLLAAPFGYDGDEVDHWYAWDIDACWILNVVAAGVFESAPGALAEWQHAVGPAAGTDLSPCPPELTARLLGDCLQTGPMAEMLEGSEPRELIREYYRFRRRARALVPFADAPAAAPSPGTDEDAPVREAFLNWYSARHDDISPGMDETVGTIAWEWGPSAQLGERSRYACSPHRIEMTARLIRDSYYPDHANEALQLLPEWTQWCIEQTSLPPDFAARSRAAALTEAATLVDEEKRHRVQPADPPYRRPE